MLLIWNSDSPGEFMDFLQSYKLNSTESLAEFPSLSKYLLSSLNSDFYLASRIHCLYCMETLQDL